MKEKNSRLVVPIAVITGCLALLILVIVLASVSEGEDADPAVGFPIVLVVLAVVAGIGALVWRAVSRRKSSHHQ